MYFFTLSNIQRYSHENELSVVQFHLFGIMLSTSLRRIFSRPHFFLFLALIVLNWINLEVENASSCILVTRWLNLSLSLSLCRWKLQIWCKNKEVGWCWYTLEHPHPELVHTIIIQVKQLVYARFYLFIWFFKCCQVDCKVNRVKKYN